MAPWRAHRQPLERSSGGERVTFQGTAPLSVADVLAGWREDAAFRVLTIETLAAAPHPAIFWEMPPLLPDRLDDAYECVLLPASGLAGARPDPTAFAAHFAVAADELVTTFENLGGDAWLVAPCPQAPPDAYGHLAAFLRLAPIDQRHDLLRTLGTLVPSASSPGRCGSRRAVSASPGCTCGSIRRRSISSIAPTGSRILFEASRRRLAVEARHPDFSGGGGALRSTRA